MSNFNSKTALIIGGTSGIGRATTEALLNQGATVHIVGRNPQKIADAPNLLKHKVDITNRAEVAQLITTIEQFSNLDYLVNASGIFGPKPFLDHTPEDYDAYLDLNRGFFFISQAAAKVMKKERRRFYSQCRFYVGKTSCESNAFFSLFHAKSWLTLSDTTHGHGIGR